MGGCRASGIGGMSSSRRTTGAGGREIYQHQFSFCVRHHTELNRRMHHSSIGTPSNNNESIDLKRYKVKNLLGNHIESNEIPILAQGIKECRTANYIAFQIKIIRVS